MAMLDSLFNKGFKGAKCKTLLKLTIPRIKLLRNRREMQIKQMRKDIAKLLETGQEATARIRVEHIIREESFTAAQEIIELFCELISVRLPIIEIQRECPLDLKEAVSSVCFAAPRCADLPELMQVQMLFGFKYGKEFVSSATELMPECGVNRQLIELLSIRAPPPEKKLKLLKDIAEEHGVEWDPAATEAEFLKIHDDVLNGPQFVSGEKVPIPREKHEDPDELHERFDALVLPEVPKSSPQTFVPVMSPIPFDHSFFDSEPDRSKREEELNLGESAVSYLGEEPADAKISLRGAEPAVVLDLGEESGSRPATKLGNGSGDAVQRMEEESPPARKAVEEKVMVDLQEVIAAARVAAENAESAASAARSAASLAQSRMSEIARENDSKIEEMNSENPFSSGSSAADVHKNEMMRLPSIEDETDFTYPNLFSSSNV